ncbi:hypothetical protein [Ktedonobacter robiniae]|uniref:Uncharacterized protein n=1 Tax=Ktedonobacter robiniae TaxID=2778365 RepID=A0ABQ3UYR8_9CHLR|nr:hypothetical protein [Ktedonobacter robiniae]GHO57856.1 hypothetical protein KSB_63310 [Ktedonobacter robiniae]
MDERSYIINFENASPTDASRYAEELRNVLLDQVDDIKVQRKRSNTQAQDFGTTLVLILGTPAVVTAATTIGSWLQRRNAATLTLETPNKKIIVQNVTGKDAARLAELMLASQPEDEK